MVDTQSVSSAGSFEFYEGIRIFIPGALVAALFAAGSATFTGASPELPGGALGAITLSILSGLVLYYVDVPTKSAAYKKGLPADILDEWGLVPPKGTRGTVNTYFVLLDEIMPPTLRARALYQGSIFRIGFEAIHLLTFASVGVLTAAAMVPLSKGSTRHAGGPWPVPLAVGVAVTALVIYASAVHFESGRKRRAAQRRAMDSDRPGGAAKKVIAQDPTGMVCRIVVGSAIAVALLAAFPVGLPLGAAPAFGLTGRRACFAVAVAIAWGCGVTRYFQGRPKSGAANDPLDQPAAVFSMLPALALALFAGVRTEFLGGAGIPSSVAAAWAGVYLVALIVIVSRGHEKKLSGAYATQATWLRYNEEAIRSRYDTTWTDPVPISTTPPSCSRDRWWRWAMAYLRRD